MKKYLPFIFLLFVILSLPVLGAESYMPPFDKQLQLTTRYEGGCWFCPVFRVIWATTDSMAITIYKGLAEALRPLFLVMCAFWLAWMVFQLYFGLLGEMGDIFKKLFKIFLIIIVVAGALSYPDFVFGYIISPIIEVGAGICNAILEVLSDIGAGESIASARGKISHSGVTFKALPKEAYDSLYMTVYLTSAAVLEGISAIGAMMWATFFKALSLLFYLVFILIFYLLLMVVIPLKLIDALIRLCLAIVLAPLFVFFWAFPVTKTYAINGVKLLIVAMATFVSTCAFVVFGLVMISESGSGWFGKVLNRLKEDKLDGKFLNSLNIDLADFVLMFLALILAKKLLDLAPNLGSMLIEGHGGDTINPVVGGKISGAVSKIKNKAKSAATKDEKKDNINTPPDWDENKK